ncbi:hypothetical protein Droror1_Dr00020232 [Drosera rotundifolia]
MCSKTHQVGKAAAMSVSVSSSQRYPFYPSHAAARFTTSFGVAETSASRFCVIRSGFLRHDMHHAKSSCGAPTNLKLFNYTIQLRRHSSNSYRSAPSFQLRFQNDRGSSPTSTMRPSFVSHYQPKYQDNARDPPSSSSRKPSFNLPYQVAYQNSAWSSSDISSRKPSLHSSDPPRYLNNTWEAPSSFVKKHFVNSTGNYGRGVYNGVRAPVMDEEDTMDSPLSPSIDSSPLNLGSSKDRWKIAGLKEKLERGKAIPSASKELSKAGQVSPKGVQAGRIPPNGVHTGRASPNGVQHGNSTSTGRMPPSQIASEKQPLRDTTKVATAKPHHVSGSHSKQMEPKKLEEHESENSHCTVNRADETYSIREEAHIDSQEKLRKRLCTIYDKVLVVDTVSSAEKVVSMLTNEYRHLVHACDTEVTSIDVKQETPVDHGEITCFSIYSGEGVDFGDGKSCIWVDVLDGGGKELLTKFKNFFEDPSIKKVWHNYSFDSHIIENYGIKVSGFHADTMHMARLWDSSRRLEGGYSLEALTSDQRVMSTFNHSAKGKSRSGTKFQQAEELIGKVSYKTIFGRQKVKKDGTLGKTTTIASVEELQRGDREPWICYSCLDSIKTLELYDSLKSKLSCMPWIQEGSPEKVNGKEASMLNFYEYYWRPFGELLVRMETEGMLVDRSYLAELEKVAVAEQKAAADRFRNWASRYCPDAMYMNVGSDTQLRQLFFGGMVNRKNSNECLPVEKVFKVPNIDNVIEKGKKNPTKFRKITLHRIDCNTQAGVSTESMEEGASTSLITGPPLIKTDLYTATGWPSVSGDALKALAGKVSWEYDFGDETPDSASFDDTQTSDESAYGTAYSAFGKGREGKEACHAIAALCEVCSIDSLISNFILPLQGSHVAGKNGRVHCSLNINTETGRLSARRPNLQNQPALEKDRYKIRKAFVAAPGNSLVVADYGQLELRILAHLADCKSMKEAFKAGGDFHSRTAMNMYPYIREAVEKKQVLLEWHPEPGESKPPVPLLKDAYGSERRKAKMLNFSIAYGKTAMGLAKDWKVSVREAKETVKLWYKERQEVLRWQKARREEAFYHNRVHTLLGRCRRFPSMTNASSPQRGHIERAAINTPVQGSAADVAMCAMLEISKNQRLKDLGWKLLLQVHDEVILEGPTGSAEEAKALVIACMSKPFDGKNILNVDLAVDAKCAQNWYDAK